MEWRAKISKGVDYNLKTHVDKGGCSSKRLVLPGVVIKEGASDLHQVRGRDPEGKGKAKLMTIEASDDEADDEDWSAVLVGGLNQVNLIDKPYGEGSSRHSQEVVLPNREIERFEEAGNMMDGQVEQENNRHRLWGDYTSEDS